MNAEFTLAVHALVFLSHKKTTVSSEMLAANICTNAAYVRKVMLPLKRDGLVKTKAGRQSGGYLFDLDASRVTLSRIAKALNTDFIAPSWTSGNIDKECLISSGMGDIMNGIYSVLNEKCREYLESITIADIERLIFQKKSE